MMISENEIPLVKGRTSAQSESVETIVGRMDSGDVYIPDYQRDSDQWDERKKSLFIESLLNNLTIPAFFLCEQEDYRYEVVDGQQRLTTILDFIKDRFSLSQDESIDYLLPQSVQYKGKNFSDLGDKLQRIFNGYPLTIIYLPSTMPLSIKLEVFRRINEGGTPLTGQDIRLAYYSQSETVTFIRLCGLHADSESSKRMIEAAKKRELSNPWLDFPEAQEEWSSWWSERAQAKGQTPSLMFLWYLVCLERKKLHNLLTPGGTQHLNIVFRGTTEEVLDIYCAQLKYQESQPEKSNEFVSNLKVISQEYFPPFAEWIKEILSYGLTGVSVDTYKQLALFIAGAVELKVEPKNLSHNQWTSIGNFLRRPRQASKDILKVDDGYPEPKGRWLGKRGQNEQCKKVVEIVKAIIENND
ncbi:hypothetical protein AM228_20135 [Planktothricoides sp. SR001]|uniref:DUF262 domain-containing protein n=1 Tax=Planktothricoides sp. SR001 TaxID=1705388 RepID=UPI0006BEFC30|nr:DUF262 domain-containing protein [Planktothricoides sp. SR001]KOR35112.1 hypothetical protein AM228_20135 [Planktothricoides sp. SR001]